MEYITKILPEWLQAYFLHGSTELFDEGEKEIVDKFISDNKLGQCVDVIELTEENDNFSRFNDLLEYSPSFMMIIGYQSSSSKQYSIIPGAHVCTCLFPILFLHVCM